MNCKPGDLAIIVKSYQGNHGKIVQCLRLAHGICWEAMGKVPTWEISPQVNNSDPRACSYMPDAFLRPIRDPGDDAKDESRAWLPPVPSTQKEFV